MEVLESVLGYTFRDRQILTLALTHGSVGYKVPGVHANNQRLEFLGDAVLQLTIAELLYHRMPEAPEGSMTKMRAQIVSAKALASVARKFKLGDFLILGASEQASGGRKRESTLADVLEAITGAVYLDGGLAQAQALTRRLFAEEVEKKLLLEPAEQNPKGQLQEIIQSVGPVPPSYAILTETGPAHARTFTVSVNWLGHPLGSGSGNSKKEAEAEAARAALKSPTLMEQLNSLVILNFKATKISGQNSEQPADNSPQPCEQLS